MSASHVSWRGEFSTVHGGPAEADPYYGQNRATSGRRNCRPLLSEAIRPQISESNFIQSLDEGDWSILVGTFLEPMPAEVFRGGFLYAGVDEEPKLSANRRMSQNGAGSHRWSRAVS